MGLKIQKYQNKKTDDFEIIRFASVLSGREDSNFRPRAPHARALANCATPRFPFSNAVAKVQKKFQVGCFNLKDFFIKR